MARVDEIFLSPLVEALGRLVSVKACFGSKLEVVDGKLTGKVVDIDLRVGELITDIVAECC